MDGSIIRKTLKKMLEVLVAQYPLSDVWALPGVRAGGSQLAQEGLGRWGWPSPTAGCPVEKGETQVAITAWSEGVPLPLPQSIHRDISIASFVREVQTLNQANSDPCLGTAEDFWQSGREGDTTAACSPHQSLWHLLLWWQLPDGQAGGSKGGWADGRP